MMRLRLMRSRSTGIKTGPPEFRTETSSYTADPSDQVILVDASSAPVTITLPAVTVDIDSCYVVKKIDSSANAVTIDGNGAETIDGSATLVLSSQWDSAWISNDGSAWYVLARGL